MPIPLPKAAGLDRKRRRARFGAARFGLTMFLLCSIHGYAKYNNAGVSFVGANDLASMRTPAEERAEDAPNSFLRSFEFTDSA